MGKRIHLDDQDWLCASSYPLVDWDRCIDENVGFVGYARLLFFVFTRGLFEVVDLSLHGQLSFCNAGCVGGYLGQRWPHGGDEKAITALKMESALFKLAHTATCARWSGVPGKYMASLLRLGRNGSESHFG